MTGDALLRLIRRRRLKRFVPACVLSILSGVLAAVLFVRYGAEWLILLLPALLLAVTAVHHLTYLLHPERCAVFRKYGSPAAVAEMLSKESGSVFFENRYMQMTEHWLMRKDDPESLMRFEWILLVSLRHSGTLPLPRGKFLAAHDCWGFRCIYPFSAGERQIFKPEILLDKIKKKAPGCRIGSAPQYRRYVREHRRPLPVISKENEP